MQLDSKKIIDISMDLNEKTVVWTKDPAPQLKPICRLPEAECNFTWLDFSAHAGTHVDAPYYLFPDKWTSDKIPFNRMIGNCQVIDMTHVDDMITVKDLEKININEKIILIKTMNSFDKMEKYNPKHVAMTEEGAKYLVDKGVTTIGYDYQSFERNGENKLHEIFMKKDIICIDNLRLAQAVKDRYFFICLPVKVTGIDAGPARAILIDN